MKARLGDHIRYCSNPGECIQYDIPCQKDRISKVVKVYQYVNDDEEYVTMHGDVIHEDELTIDDILLPSEVEL